MLNIFRKYYLPGSISLLLLPLTIYGFFEYHHSLTPNYALEFNMYKTFNHQPRFYNTFEMSSNAGQNGSSLVAAHQQVSKIALTHDTLTGVAIHLGNSVRWQTFIQIVDMLMDTKVVYFYDGNYFWAWINRQTEDAPHNLPALHCCIKFFDDVLLEQEAEKKYSTEIQEEKNILLSLWLPIILFIAISLLAIRYFK